MSLWNVLPGKIVLVSLGALGHERVYANTVTYGLRPIVSGQPLDGWRLTSATWCWGAGSVMSVEPTPNKIPGHQGSVSLPGWHTCVSSNTAAEWLQRDTSHEELSLAPPRVDLR